MGKQTINRIGDGIITALSPQVSAGDFIETNVPESVILMGSPLIDTNGSVVGLSTGASRGESGSSFVSVSALLPPPAPVAKETVPAKK